LTHRSHPTFQSWLLATCMRRTIANLGPATPTRTLGEAITCYKRHPARSRHRPASAMTATSSPHHRKYRVSALTNTTDHVVRRQLVSAQDKDDDLTAWIIQASHERKPSHHAHPRKRPTFPPRSHSPPEMINQEPTPPHFHQDWDATVFPPLLPERVWVGKRRRLVTPDPVIGLRYAV